MDEVLKVIAIIALTSITVLVIYMIVFFSKTVKILNDASKSIDKIIEIVTVLKTRVIITLDEFSETKKDFKDLKEKTLESIDKWKVTSDKANDLIDTVTDGANKVIETIEPYERLVSRSYDKIAPPIDKVASIVSAVTKAVEVFSSKLRSKS